jgi:multiple sugar transport system substrate-binding protein
MTKKNPSHQSAGFSRRTLLQAGAVTFGAIAFPLPAIAQTKPFAGITLRGASFQHRFFTLLQNYIPEFETHGRRRSPWSTS